jgi:hypothetical protein
VALLNWEKGGKEGREDKNKEIKRKKGCTRERENFKKEKDKNPVQAEVLPRSCHIRVNISGYLFVQSFGFYIWYDMMNAWRGSLLINTHACMQYNMNWSCGCLLYTNPSHEVF